MEFETDKWTIRPSKVDEGGVGVFLTADVIQGELLGTAHMLDPNGFVTGYFSSLGRYHNHSSGNPNFQAFVEGGFTRLTALRNCNKGDEVLVNYNDYRYIPNIEIPEDIKEVKEVKAISQKEEQKAKPKAKPKKIIKPKTKVKPKMKPKPKKRTTSALKKPAMGDIKRLDLESIRSKEKNKTKITSI